MHVQDAIKKETARIGMATVIGTVIMCAVFFGLHRAFPEAVPFDYTVILGGAAGRCRQFLFHGTDRPGRNGRGRDPGPGRQGQGFQYPEGKLPEPDAGPASVDHHCHSGALL